MAQAVPAGSGSADTVLVIGPPRASAAAELATDGHRVLRASSEAVGLELAQREDVGLVVLALDTPDLNPERFVDAVRAMRPSTQVVLTAPSGAPMPGERLRRLAAHSFHCDGESPEGLRIAVQAGLRAATTLASLQRRREGLRHVLDVTPRLHRSLPHAELVQVALREIVALLEAEHGFIAVPGETGRPTIAASTGRHRDGTAAHHALTELLAGDTALVAPEVRADATIIPLQVGERSLGTVVVEGASAEWELDLLHVLANQVAVALHNASLFEMAMLDAVTGVSTRRSFEQSMTRELRSATRTAAPVALLVVDVDEMKTINDTLGHEAGDRALAGIGRALRGATRATDVVGRLGGDEFAVLLPATDDVGLRTVLDRAAVLLRGVTVWWDGSAFTASASVGGAALVPDGALDMGLIRGAAGALLGATATRLRDAADGCMYEAKQGRRGDRIPRIGWQLPGAHASTTDLQRTESAVFDRGDVHREIEQRVRDSEP